MVVPEVPVRFAEKYQPVRDGDGFTLIGEDAGNRSFCLLELEEEVINELQAGEPLYFKAGADNSAVLCNSSKAYTVEFHENSNSLFLAQLVDGEVEDVLDSSKAADENKETVSTDSKHVNETKQTASTDIKPVDEKKETPGTNSKPADEKQETASAKKEHYNIFAACLGNIAIKVIPPDTAKLKKMLEPHSLGEIHFEGAEEPPTTADLEYNVAASYKEIQEFLEAGPCVQDGQAWRWLPKEFEREILEVALDSLTAKGWSFSRVDPLELLKVVQDNLGPNGEAQVPSADVLVKVLRSLTAPPGKADDKTDASASATAVEPDANGTAPEPESAVKEVGDEDKTKISLDPSLVRRFRAEMLLNDPAAKVRAKFSPPAPPPLKRARLAGGGSIGAMRDAPLRAEEFMHAWRESLGIDAEEVKDSDLTKLYGVIAYENLLEGTVHSMDGKNLPLKPLERLKVLFQLTPHWKPDVLEDLLRPALPNQKVDVWLNKYTRTVHLELEEGKETRVHVKKFNMGGA